MGASLKTLNLRNFRGFSDHRIDFGPENVLVGKNNAGKSTIIEALLLVSLTQRKFRTARYLPTPDWIGAPVGSAGISPSTKTIEFDYVNVTHNYSSDPARITAKFTNHNTIDIFIGREEGQIFCILKDKGREAVHSTPTAKTKNFGTIRVMPPIAPLLIHEKILDKKYLRDSLDSRLAYRHFRNQLAEMPAEYRSFRDLAEATWKGLRFWRLESDHGKAGNELSFQVQDGPYVSEIAWMGHGLQAWLQTLWFLCRAPKGATVVLDEPDVYLHADLQRKIVRLLEDTQHQIIVATHSAEIIADVNPEAVIVVEKRGRRSQAATSVPAVQTILDHVGTIHNIQLAKLAAEKKLIFVEGKDFYFLSKLFHKINPERSEQFSSIPHLSTEGAENWRLAAGAANAIKENSSAKMKVYCICDRDYRTDQYMKKNIKNADKYGLNIYYWKMKEIENYFLVPDAIARSFEKQNSEASIEASEIENQLYRIFEDLKSEIISSISDQIRQSDKKMSTKTCVEEAFRTVSALWIDFESKQRIVPGKLVISRLSAWAQDNYGVCFNAGTLCQALMPSELHPEIKQVLTSINAGRDLKP